MAILLVPLFFINVKDSHDWGDDFAQYLIQARNIVEGKAQTDNGLLFSKEDPAYAIEAYPVGFPLIITPVYIFFKLNILPYCVLFSFILFAAGIFSFEFFRKRTNNIIAILITLLFCYNVHTLELKKQILSEISFTSLLLFIFLWFESNFYRKDKSWIITGILLAFLISIRLAGLALIAAYLIYSLNNLRLRNDSENIKKKLYSLLTALLAFFLFNGILFPIKAGGLFSFYYDAFSSHELQFTNNVNFYYIVSEYLFPFHGSWIPSPWIFLPLIGWLIRLIKKPSICEYFFPLYLLLIIFYPYSNAGLRFLIPVLPFLVFYTAYFINVIFQRLGENSFWISAVILTIPLTSYYRPIHAAIKSRANIEDGPQLKVAVELFNFIKTTPKESAIVFCKARAMTLYSGHPALYTAKNQSDEDTFEQFHRYDKLYLVIAKVTPDNEIYDPKLLNYISIYKDQYEHIWANERFNVYKQR